MLKGDLVDADVDPCVGRNRVESVFCRDVEFGRVLGRHGRGHRRGARGEHDLPIDLESPRAGGVVELCDLEVGLCDGDGRADVYAGLDLSPVLDLGEVSPWVDGDDLVLVEPRRVGPDVEDGLGVGVVWALVGVQGPDGDGEGVVDRVRPTVRSDGVAQTERHLLARGEDGATFL